MSLIDQIYETCIVVRLAFPSWLLFAQMDSSISIMHGQGFDSRQMSLSQSPNQILFRAHIELTVYFNAKNPSFYYTIEFLIVGIVLAQ